MAMSDESRRFIRIRKVVMRNFRNIEVGKVDFPNSNCDDCRDELPSILGLYGQNGSGKTSLVMALHYLKRALSGVSVDLNYNGCVREGCDHAELEFEFEFWTDDSRDITVNYSFCLTEKEKPTTDKDGNNTFENVVSISNEVLFYSGIDENDKIGKTVLINTSAGASKKGYAFGRDSSYESLIGKDKTLSSELREEKAVRYSESKSFIFSEKFLDIVSQSEKHQLQSEILFYLHLFGVLYLHIIDNHSTGINNMNVVLPLFVWQIENENRITSRAIPVKMGKYEAASVAEEHYPAVCSAVESLNQVLSKLVPGLSVEIQDLGSTKNSRGQDVRQFSLFSVRKGIKIPLNCESDGIRRIISIMSLLVAVFNQRSMTVVIDEIDSGIYEYLLGEILRIMAYSCKGQLVFTSHNLRALEVLPSKYICFTSTNPEKRFVKITRFGNSNLRDQYYKKIVLGGNDVQLYEPTDNFAIELAFYNAGRIQDKTL